MAKKVFYDDEARNRVLEGAHQLYDAVKVTMGPKGRNVVIGKSYGAPSVTHDGVTVAKAIELPEEFVAKDGIDTLGHGVGAELIKQAATKMNDVAGDGTTTITILTYFLLAEANRLVAAGHNPMDLRKGLEDAAKKVSLEVGKISEKIGTNKKRITEVAAISASDKKIGELIANVIEKIGKEGVVTVEEGQGLEMESEVVEGFSMDRGFVSAYMVTDTARMEAVLDKPVVLITDKKLSSVQEFLPILEKAAQAGKKDMVIIAEEVEGEALGTLILNKLKGVFNALAIKAPAFGEQRKDILEDIAALTGGTVISEERGDSFEDVTLDMLGSARKIIADKDNSTIIEGNGNPSEIEARVKQIKNQIESASSEYDKENLEKRLAALQGKVAVIRVGGATETEIEEKKYRVDDAVAATKAAMAEGIVPGGCVTLVDLSRLLEVQEKNISNSFEAGELVLKKALREPFKRLMDNAGLNGETKLTQLIEKTKQGSGIGFDVNDLLGSECNLKEEGIIDPAKVVKEVIQNAVSVAGTAMTMGSLIVDIPEEEKAPAMPPGGGMGMGM